MQTSGGEQILETTTFFTPKVSGTKSNGTGAKTGRQAVSSIYFTPQSRMETGQDQCDPVEGDPEEALQLKQANLVAVRSVLARLNRMLDDPAPQPSFSGVTYRDPATGHTDTFLHLLLWKTCLASGVPGRSYTTAMEEVLQVLEDKVASSPHTRGKVAALLAIQETAQGMTVLHMATIKWGKEVVRRLLRLGAEVCVGDVLHKLAVARINPGVLGDFLDTKWKPRGYPDEEQDPDTQDYAIDFDFLFLESRTDPDKPHSPLQVLADLSHSPQHRHLLTHPVVSTYLALQWENTSVSLCYSLNTAFTLLTCIVANLFILSNYGGQSVRPLSSRANWTECEASWSSSSFPSVLEDTSLTLLWVVLLLCTLGLAAREGVQAAAAWLQADLREHLVSLENWLEILFLLATSVLLVFTAKDQQPVCAMRALAASLLLVSWILFFNMVARNPSFHKQNIHITMFFKVMQMFIKIFIIFAPYILAFGLFFYVSLHKDFEQEEKHEADKTCSDIKQEILQEINGKGEFLDKVGFSVLKTMAMFVGELEFSDIPFENMPYFSHLTFLTFVFLIVVVLMNLLTGLAVSMSIH